MTLNDWNNTLSDLPDTHKVAFADVEGESCRAWAGEIRGVLAGDIPYTFVVPDTAETSDDFFKMDRAGFLACMTIT